MTRENQLPLSDGWSFCENSRALQKYPFSHHEVAKHMVSFIILIMVKKQTLRLGVHVKSSGMVRQSVFSWKQLSFSEARELTDNPFLVLCCKRLAVTQVVKYVIEFFW